MRKHFFLIALLALSVASCKKDPVQNNNDNGGGTPPPPPPPASKLLQKMTQTTNGVSTVYNFVYNNAKQLTAVKTADNSEEVDFTYDGEGNVVKLENLEPNFHNIYTYHYENGVPASGTFKSYERNNGAETLSEDDVIHYDVTDGKVTKMSMDLTLEQQEVDFVLTYDNSGNVTKIKTDGSDNYTAEFTYGTKKPMFPRVFKYVMDHAGFSMLFYAKNEMLSQHYDFPGTDNDMTTSTQYTYDQSGYILTSDDGTTKSTFTYQ